MSSQTWSVVYVSATGEAVSVGTVVADPLPEGLSAAPLSPADADLLLAGGAAWDAATRSVVVPPPPVPAEVTRWQFRRWLVDHGIAPEKVEALIESSIIDPLDKVRALVDWRDAPIVRRAHPLLVPMARALGLTEAAVDAAFREAAQYE